MPRKKIKPITRKPGKLIPIKKPTVKRVKRQVGPRSLPKGSRYVTVDGKQRIHTVVGEYRPGKKEIRRKKVRDVVSGRATIKGIKMTGRAIGRGAKRVGRGAKKIYRKTRGKK